MGRRSSYLTSNNSHQRDFTSYALSNRGFLLMMVFSLKFLFIYSPVCHPSIVDKGIIYSLVVRLLPK